MSLESLGFKEVESFQQQELLQTFVPARVMAVHRDSYVIHNGEQELPAEVTGRMIGQADSPLDFPTVGDWVYAQWFEDMAIIHHIFPRKTLLKRKASGQKIEFQLIAANVDDAFIIQGLDRDYNIRRLERYLAMVSSAAIQPVVLLSKVDLITDDLLNQYVGQITGLMPDIIVCAFSNISGRGLPEVIAQLHAARTYCLIGSSGVGKTSLLNTLIGDSAFRTNEVRGGDQRGRHTTTGRQLIVLKNDALLIDTPGMRELGNFEIEEGIDATFPEIAEQAGQCHFADCRHGNEKGCAVREALNDGRITAERFESYLKLQRESERLQMSYAEKRRKDKDLGKFYKSVLKNNLKNNLKK